MNDMLGHTMHEHDPMVVATAALCWLLGSYALFFLLQRSRECSQTRQNLWLALASVAAGSSVWTTHFVAMLGYRGHAALTFDFGMTALSVIECIALFFVALKILGRKANIARSFTAGTVAAFGVSVMHFTGMAAIRAPIRVEYDFLGLVPAVLICGVLFGLAFALFNRFNCWRRVIGAAICAQIAVFTLHFGAMAATSFITVANANSPDSFLSSQTLIVGCVSTSIMVIALIALGAVLDRLLTDLRGLSEAVTEGLIILHEGRIVETNSQFRALLGVDVDDLIGSEPGDWLAGVHGQSLALVAGICEEVTPTRGDTDRLFEITTRWIEYRGRDCQALAVRDLTDNKRALREIEFLAEHDPLTALPNRAYLNRKLKTLCVSEGRPAALLALDLDRFKAVNDVFGHATGDELLCRVAGMLKSVLRPRDVVARVGGDEFLILQHDGPQPAAAEALSRRILDLFAVEMNVAFDPTAVGVTIGISLYPSDAQTPEKLRDNADIALYRAKANGRGTACFFDAAMETEVREKRSLEQDLRQALRVGQFYLVYQSLVSTRDATPIGYEALVRWRHPVRGEVSPATFIPIAEEMGLILQLGEWVLKQACLEASSWSPELRLAVNVSPVQFQLANLVSMVKSAVAATNFDPSRLELEVTESVLLQNKDNVLTMLGELKAIGIKIVMDDFGTGYSSLSNLQSFPFDKIKIDRSFISALDSDDAARSIVRAIVGLGRSLGLPVVAEGVENEAQRQIVMDEGCPQAQGYLFGLPGPVLGVSGDQRSAA